MTANSTETIFEASDCTVTIHGRVRKALVVRRCAHCGTTTVTCDLEDAYMYADDMVWRLHYLGAQRCPAARPWLEWK